MVETSNSDGVMIALLPSGSSEWCHIELPHMTLVYAGVVDDLPPTAFNELAKDSASIAMLSGPIGLQVIARETFGENKDTDVYRLRPSPELWAMRRSVERWNASQHSFNPHVTIGPIGTFVEFPPRYVHFDRIVVEWGDEQLPFSLKGR